MYRSARIAYPQHTNQTQWLNWKTFTRSMLESTRIRSNRHTVDIRKRVWQVTSKAFWCFTRWFSITDKHSSKLSFSTNKISKQTEKWSSTARMLNSVNKWKESNGEYRQKKQRRKQERQQSACCVHVGGRSEWVCSFLTAHQHKKAI